MSKKVLFTRPEHDDATHYLSNWSLDSMRVAEKSGFQVINLHRDRANRKETESIIKKQNPNLIVFNGHGSPDSVTGDKREILIQAGKNEDILKQKITYAIACSSAKELGPKSVAAGAKAYIGYDDEFIFFYDPNKISKPLSDETAELFLEPSNKLVKSLIKGNTILESVSKAKDQFRENMSRLLSTASSPRDASMARYLWWDRRHLTFSGEEDITV